MIDSLSQDSIDTSLDDRQARPVFGPQPQSGPTIWNAFKAPFKGAAAGATESVAFGADMLGAFGEVQGGFAAQADPSLLLSPDEMDKRRKDGEAARERVASGMAFSTEIGTGLRTTAREWMPDPTSSSTVENVLFSGARGITKAVGYAATATPLAGAALFGADEALTEADKLKAEGVDIETRTKAGAVAGLAAGVGAAVPMAGSTISRTAALVVASGPGLYVAQQSASREILKNAGYDKLSDQYDPFDPVGLAVSTLVPAAFGVYGMRGARGAKAPTVAPDAARALSQMGAKERQALRYDDTRLDAYAVTAAQREGIPPEALLAIKNAGERSGSSAATSPVGAKGIMQFMDATWNAYGKGDVRDPIANIDASARYMRALIDQYGGDVRAAIAHYNGGGKAGEAVRAGKAPPAAETVKYLQRTDAFMAQHAGESAGRAAAGDPDAVPAARAQLLRDTIESWNLKDPTDISAAQDHLAAIVRASDQLGAGERVDVSSLISWDTLQQTRMLDDMVGRLESARAELLPEAGNVAEGGTIRQMRQEIESLRRAAPEVGEEAIKAHAKEIQTEGEGRISYKQALAAAKKEIGQQAQENEARISHLERQIETNRAAEEAKTGVSNIERQIAGLRQQREALNAPPSPIRPTALAAGELARTEAPRAPEAGRAPVEAPETAKPAPEGQAPVEPTTTPEVQQAANVVDNQAAEIAKLSPDMLVQFEGMDQPVRLADALEAIKAEADKEIADAPLLEVAATCFLRNS